MICVLVCWASVPLYTALGVDIVLGTALVERFLFSHAALEVLIVYMCNDIPYGVKFSFLHQLKIDLM